MKPTLDQERAAYAWKVAAKECDDKYRNLAKAAPALIMTGGLMQTLAFYNEKGKGHHRKLLQHLLGWLCRDSRVLRPNTQPNFDSVMQALYNASSEDYRYATEEALALLRWIRQFAGIKQA